MAPTISPRRSPDPKPLWGTGDVAAFLKVHPATVRKLVNSGKLPAVDLNGRMKFQPAVVEQWLDERGWGRAA